MRQTTLKQALEAEYGPMVNGRRQFKRRWRKHISAGTQRKKRRHGRGIMPLWKGGRRGKTYLEPAKSKRRTTTSSSTATAPRPITRTCLSCNGSGKINCTCLFGCYSCSYSGQRSCTSCGGSGTRF